MANTQPIIIIKKKHHGGHAGHHGGAWKVAYADFVTAMMCFFLVMWLMAADEATLAAIEHYFNHPNTPYKGSDNPDTIPLGDKVGRGESILNGAQGQVPEDLIDSMPKRPTTDDGAGRKEDEELSDVIKQLLDDQAYGFEVNADYIKFSVPTDLLFKPGTNQFKSNAITYLDRLGKIFKPYRGYVTIAGHTGEAHGASGFEFTLSQSVAVMQYMVENRFGAEDKFAPTADGDRKQFTDDQAMRSKNNRIEFTLSRKRAL